MEAILTTGLVLLVLLFIAIAGTAVYIFIHVFNRQRKLRKEWDKRTGGRW